MSGLNCEGCKENYPYAEANQPNGKLVCYGCKSNGFVYNAPKNNWLHYSDVSINKNVEKYNFIKTLIGRSL